MFRSNWLCSSADDKMYKDGTALEKRYEWTEKSPQMDSTIKSVLRENFALETSRIFFAAFAIRLGTLLRQGFSL